NGGRVFVTRDNSTRSTSGYMINAGGLLEISNGVTLHLDGLTMRGGKISSASSLTGSAASYGSYNLDTGLTAGGVAETSEISALGGTLNQSGGTVLNVLSGATNGVDLLISGSLITVNPSTGITSTGLTKRGDGVLMLSGANSFTDGVRLESGMIRAGSTTAFGLNNAVTVSNRAATTLDLNNFNVTIGTLSGGGSAGGNVTLGSGNLTLGADNGSGSFGGVISGTGAVTKTGTGTQTLTGQNTFTGRFTQNQGVMVLANTNGPALFNGQGGDIVIGNIGGSSTYSILRMGAANQLGTNVNVTFGANATTTSYGTLDLMGRSLSIGNLNISGNTALAHIQNSQSVSSTGNSTLTIHQTTNGSFTGLIRDYAGGGTGTLGI
ncbi:MAG: hypothetical protein EBT36_14415, partial [Betaproteobacteria bacterium]|nr:hypothetical protein [Betaproteobacteria bacterium]